jgi:phage baseplate assembly protein W
MAFNPQIIPATDFYPNVGVGVNIPFSSPSVFWQTFTTQAAIKANMINYLLTEPGERYDNPTFGFGFRRYLFEQIEANTLENIQIEVSNIISSNFPTITVNQILVTPNTQSQTISISIYYSFTNQSINDQIEINLS